MEVSYTFHSFLIGKSGQHIIELMNQTKTRYSATVLQAQHIYDYTTIHCDRINFPDHNRIADHPKSSKIVIRGEMVNIENARQRIRVSKIYRGNFYLFLNLKFSFSFAEKSPGRIQY